MLDHPTEWRLQAAIDHAMATASQLVIDLSELGFLGTAGLALLLLVHDAAANRGLGFAVISGDNRRVLRPALSGW